MESRTEGMDELAGCLPRPMRKARANRYQEMPAIARTIR
jgi:hypothetical protein